MQHNHLSQTEYSYGVVPFFKNEEGNIEILFVCQVEGKWGFPKGHSEENEDPLITAQREFSEETGITDFELLDPFLFTETYTHTKDGISRVKIVEYAPVLVLSKDTDIQEAEIAEIAWVTLSSTPAFELTPGRAEVYVQACKYVTEKHL